MVRTCPHCGCSEIDEDAARGDATCMGCGTVLEENVVVSDNQFQERAGGSGHTLVGQFVSMERQSHTLQGVPGLVSQESRELTYLKGKRLIEEIASQLRINQFCIDTSYNFFKMCVVKNLTRGRIRAHVVAACMYMTCRLENTAHLLLDFSDVTQVNVFDLGRTLSFLSRSLKINLPSTDPCLYIMRFACLLEFGDKQKEVVNLATRLVERMKRDWISTGRRPTGLCGAALLIASRAYNFNRSIGDVVRVVHISESVVRKRLDEFSQTASGALTIDAFQNVDLDQCEDPPAYKESLKKEEEKIRQELQMADLMTDDVHLMEVEVEKALEKKRREKFRCTPYAKMVTGVDEIGVGKAEAALVRDQIMETVYEAADGSTPQSSSMASQFGPTLQSLGIAPTHSVNAQNDHLPACDNPNGELNLEDIDDDEIDSYILSNAESQVKERFWMKMNGEHLKEMERRKREREEEDQANPDQKKKRKKPSGSSAPKAESGPAPSTAAEAIEKVIQEKKLSNKVNYDILKEIDHAHVFNPAAFEAGDSKKSVPTIESPSLIKRESRVQRKNAVGANSGRLNMVKEALSVSEMSTVKKEEKNDAASTSSTPDVTATLIHRNRFGIKARPNLAKSIKREPGTPSKAKEVNGLSAIEGKNGSCGDVGQHEALESTAKETKAKKKEEREEVEETTAVSTASAEKGSSESEVIPSTSNEAEKPKLATGGRLIRGNRKILAKPKMESKDVSKPPTEASESQADAETKPAPKQLSRGGLKKPIITLRTTGK